MMQRQFVKLQARKVLSASDTKPSILYKCEQSQPRAFSATSLHKHKKYAYNHHCDQSLRTKLPDRITKQGQTNYYVRANDHQSINHHCDQSLRTKLPDRVTKQGQTNYYVRANDHQSICRSSFAPLPRTFTCALYHTPTCPLIHNRLSPHNCGHKHFHAQAQTNNSTRTSLADKSNTVFALSTAPGKAGVAVIRVSGPSAFATIEAFTQKVCPKPRQAVLRHLSCPNSKERIDSCLVLWFPGPKSFTGEDVAEFHVHGGRAVVTGILNALSDFGLSTAEPGDFTKRAFHNGKLDATEVEGLADLINAETSAQRRLALRQLGGEMRRVCDALIVRITRSLAHVEAYIDFGEDDLIESEVFEEEKVNVEQLIQDMHRHIQNGRRGERIREGVRVAILGPPNAGKSSLLNALTQRSASIVSPIAGTTRDVVETMLDLDGFPVILADTAGIRHTTDVIETEGVRRAMQHLDSCDVRVCVLDGTDLNTNESGRLVLDSLLVDGESKEDLRTLFVINKNDLLSQQNREDAISTLRTRFGEDTSICFTSCNNTGVNISELMNQLCVTVKESCESGVIGTLMITQARHREALMQCVASLERFSNSADTAVAGEELRMAIRHLGRITGRVSVEEVLDVLFADFCIGK
eukprot:CFRG1978T1